MPEEFFVHVDDPVAVRKGVLETSKEAIKNLQNYEVFKSIRVRKIEHLFELKKIMSDIVQLNTQLKAVLPKSSFRVREAKGAEKEKKPKKADASADLHKLEKELAAIEGKLEKLG